MHGLVMICASRDSLTHTVFRVSPNTKEWSSGGSSLINPIAYNMAFRSSSLHDGDDCLVTTGKRALRCSCRVKQNLLADSLCNDNGYAIGN
jgi:hypothetical protein